ncbi:hypothetical protein, partial [Pelosinus sp. sgz500959]|uniref:hypothetical protein n=1 Tax=Pelosinus sp. sgz500959 TaxID=3242472 RepID=UPI003672BD13
MAIVLNLVPVEPKQNVMSQNVNTKVMFKTDKSGTGFAKTLNVETEKNETTADLEEENNDNDQLLTAMANMVLPMDVNLPQMNQSNASCNGSLLSDEPKIVGEVQSIVQPQLTNILANVAQSQLKDVVSVGVQSQLNNVIQNVVQPQLNNIVPNVAQSKLNNVIPNVAQSKMDNVIPNVVQPQLGNVIPNVAQSKMDNVIPN